MNRIDSITNAVDHEAILFMISLALSIASVYQLGANCETADLRVLFSTSAVGQSILDVLIVLLSHLVAGSTAAKDLDSIVRSRADGRITLLERSHYARTRKTILLQEMLCIVLSALIYMMRPVLTYGISCFIAAIPIFCLGPYYGVAFKRWIARIDMAYGNTGN